MPELHIVMYHYVRDLPRTRYPRIRGLHIDEFRRHLAWFRANFEMATLESALRFTGGHYHPNRDLCLLTFDDGLREHFTDVLPLLAQHRIQGLFGIITGCVEDRRVAPVHMNHFLAATLGDTEYPREFDAAYTALYGHSLRTLTVDRDNAQRSYPLDTADTAVFKWLINFQLPELHRDQTIRRLFARYCGPECAFAQDLYMSWAEVRKLQAAGMLLAGHTHRHRPLSLLSAAELDLDISTSATLLRQRTAPQDLWPFSYPYGKRNSYSRAVIQKLRGAGFHCGLTTEAGRNLPRTPRFELFRTDCNGVLERLAPSIAVA